MTAVLRRGPFVVGSYRLRTVSATSHGKSDFPWCRPTFPVAGVPTGPNQHYHPPFLRNPPSSQLVTVELKSVLSDWSLASGDHPRIQPHQPWPHAWQVPSPPNMALHQWPATCPAKHTKPLRIGATGNSFAHHFRAHHHPSSQPSRLLLIYKQTWTYELTSGMPSLL